MKERMNLILDKRNLICQFKKSVKEMCRCCFFLRITNFIGCVQKKRLTHFLIFYKKLYDFTAWQYFFLIYLSNRCRSFLLHLFAVKKGGIYMSQSSRQMRRCFLHFCENWIFPERNLKKELRTTAEARRKRYCLQEACVRRPIFISGMNL